MTQALATADIKPHVGQITMLAEYFNYELEPHVLRLYVDGLRDVPIDELRAGCRHCITTRRFMPKVAEIRESVDAARPSSDINDLFTRGTLICLRCEDSGWIITAERTDRTQPTVTRCACYQTNPRLVQPKSYSEPEREGRRR